MSFISGKLINLRSIDVSDITEKYINWFNDSKVTKHMVKGVFPNTLELQKHYYNNVILNNSNLILAIEPADQKIHIGNVGLHNINYINRNAELGICIGEKEFWGKGYGTEAVQLICKHAFEQLNLFRIELGVMSTNIGAIKSYEKIGFIKEGIKRKHVYKHGKYIDVIIMGLLKEDVIR